MENKPHSGMQGTKSAEPETKSDTCHACTHPNKVHTLQGCTELGCACTDTGDEDAYAVPPFSSKGEEPKGKAKA